MSLIHIKSGHLWIGCLCAEVGEAGEVGESKRGAHLRAISQIITALCVC